MEDISARVIAIICEHLGHSPANVVPTDTLVGLDADSLDLVEIVMELEDQFSIELSDVDVEEKMLTVQDAIDLVTKARATK